MKCPACDNEEGNKQKGVLWTCGRCEAIFSDSIYLGDSFAFVSPNMAKEEVHPSKLRYFDFTCLGSSGVVRRHGWYDPETKLVHQVG